MKRRRLWSFIALIVLVAAAGLQPAAASQEPGPAPGEHEALRHYDGPALTLRAALDEALAKNPELAALRAQVPVVRARPAQERALAPPMLEGQIWQWPINTINPANTNMYMLMAGQDFPGRGKRDLRAAVAEKDVALAESDVTIRERQIVSDVKQAYAALFIARRAIDVHLASIDVLRQIADVSQAKYTTGRISQQDVLKAVLELSTLHSDILTLEAQAQTAAAHLNVLRDLTPDAPIGPLADIDGVPGLPDTAALQQLAIDRQPELRRARIEIERAEAALTSARREYQPDFTVQGGYLVMPNQTDALLARVGITWPRAPWSHGKVDAQVAERAAMVEATKARGRAMENAVRLTVQEAYVRLKAAEQRAALLKTTILPQSQQTFDVSRVAYQADRGDFLALLDNERTLLNAQLDYYRTLSDFDQGLADLERAIGTEIAPDMLGPAAGENRR